MTAAVTTGRVSRLALVGGGGSGKSVIAAALAHQLRQRYPGGVAWLRVGGWDHRTLLQMLALQLSCRAIRWSRASGAASSRAGRC